MRLEDLLAHPTVHAALTNVTSDQHHIRPSSIEIANTTLSVSPLPGGPGVWDIAMPFDAQVVSFSLRSNKTVEMAGAKAGVTGIATRSPIEATTASLGGHGSLGSTSYNAIYSKVGSALNLSHKVFSAAGDYIALTNAYLTLTGPSTRVLRTEWTNYACWQSAARTPNTSSAAWGCTFASFTAIWLRVAT